MVVKREIFIKIDTKKLVRSILGFHMVVMVTFNIVDKVKVVRV